jgi:hypothetical protein
VRAEVDDAADAAEARPGVGRDRISRLQRLVHDVFEQHGEVAGRVCRRAGRSAPGRRSVAVIAATRTPSPFERHPRQFGVADAAELAGVQIDRFAAQLGRTGEQVGQAGALDDRIRRALDELVAFVGGDFGAGAAAVMPPVAARCASAEALSAARRWRLRR